MGISIIVAIDEKNGIGANNKLLCHLGDDLRYFKKITGGHPVIMGRNTFLSLPNGALPNRTNIVLNQSNDNFENCINCGSIEEVLNLDIVKKGQEVFVIGGAMVYRAFFDIVDKLYITRIHHTFSQSDVFFPEISNEKWKLVSDSGKQSANDKNEYDFSFLVYEKFI